MKTSSAKGKGRSHQKEVCKKILATFPELEPDDVISRPMGSSGIDIMLSPKAQKVVGLSIEAKNTKAMPGLKAMEQANYNVYKMTTPIVAWHPPRSSPETILCLINLDDLLQLKKELNDKTKE